MRAVPAEADTTGSRRKRADPRQLGWAAVTFATDGFTAGRRGRAECGQSELYTTKTVGIIVITFARNTVATEEIRWPCRTFSWQARRRPAPLPCTRHSPGIRRCTCHR